MTWRPDLEMDEEEDLGEVGLIYDAGTYETALEEYAAYLEMDPEPGGLNADRMAVLKIVLDAWEAEKLAERCTDALMAIRAHMLRDDLGQADLAAVLGSRSRASELMSRKRRLTILQAHKIYRAWKIPAHLLLLPYALARGDGEDGDGAKDDSND